MPQLTEKPMTLARETGGSVEITRDTYEDCLNIVPPALRGHQRYAMGEALYKDHYYCFWFDRKSSKYYVAVLSLRKFGRMTLDQLRALPNTA